MGEGFRVMKVSEEIQADDLSSDVCYCELRISDCELKNMQAFVSGFVQLIAES
jgi:hypothetical protein